MHMLRYDDLILVYVYMACACTCCVVSEKTNTKNKQQNVGPLSVLLTIGNFSQSHTTFENDIRIDTEIISFQISINE